MPQEKSSAGKIIVLGIQHVFAMFGATVLVPALTGINPAMALLCAGLGTWLCHIITGFKVPVFLGSSFAFIGAIIAVCQMFSDGAAVGTPAYMAGMPYAMGGIVVAGAIYLVFGLLVKLVGVERVRSFFPPIVTGPVIITIGIMLAPNAINDIVTPIANTSSAVNWGIAFIVLATLFVVSLFAKGLFKLVPILVGMVVGYIVSACFGIIDFAPVAQASFFQVPQFIFPKFDIRAIGVIAPIALVTFVEHIGDISASSAVCGKDFLKDPGLHRTLWGDGLATMLAGFLGGPANTTYSENTGVLATTKNYNPLTLRVAATFAICIAFLGKLGALLQVMPGPVKGAIAVVLYGMIASVGLRTLVENHVDFTKSRNLLIVSVMLVFGLGASGAITIGGVSISGTALAAILGIVLNKLLPERIEQDDTQPEEQA